VGSTGPVLVDTGVFGARLMPHGQLLASGYGALLEDSSYSPASSER